MMDFLSKVWALAKPYRGRLFLGVLTGVISGLIAPLLIASVKLIIGVLFPQKDVPDAISSPAWLPGFAQHWLAQAQAWVAQAQAALAGDAHAHPGAIIALVAVIPVVFFLRGLFGYLNIYLLQWTAVRAVTDLRVKLFSHLLDLSAGFFSNNRSGELISRIMNDTAALQNILGNAIAVVVVAPVTLVCMLVYLFSTQPKLTGLSMVVLPACMIPIFIFTRKIRRSARAMQAQNAELTQVMNETFTGHRVVKAYNLENTVAEQFRSAARQFNGHYMRIVRAAEMPGPLIEFLGSIGIALVLLYMEYSTSTKPSMKDFIGLVGSIFLMYQPMKSLTRLQNQVVQARAATERIFELLATRNTVPEPAAPRPLQAAGAEIQFDHVSFAYGEKTVLQDFDLRIRPGQLVALVGASGSGKTTIANLLLRFYDPGQGAIRIGGTDLRDLATRDLRRQIAVVTQENILFNDTIRRNIELGRPGAPEADILAAARHAHAHDFIAEKPEGYNTVIGEKGVMLSGGQRQRLAIARAVVKDAPILILDEATSALDTESERAVQAALDELMKGRTTICIAHRLSTILHADVIVVLDQGRILETGRHDELIQRGGIYQKLYELQFRD
jgi:ATP-binding cassette, subfamily B, bacterial MsbA